jgi:low temperature requirement protein LtrA
MMQSKAAALLRSPGGSQRATLLELLFDLVFVAALALTSRELAADLSWAGAVKGLLPLMGIWWVWSITAITTDFYDPTRAPIQTIIITSMLGSVLLAATLPTVFGPHALLFAITYVVVNLSRGVILVTALRGHLAQTRAARFMSWFAASGVAWIVGGLVRDTTMRAILWVVALTVDYVGAGFRYPTPRVGRVPLDQYSSAGQHLGERYQQFMTLALGDLLLVPTLAYADTPLSGARTGVFLATFATTVLLWQIYVYRAGLRLQTVIDRNPGRIVRWAPYTYLVMVAGVVATAAGFELAINRPMGTTPPSWAAVIVGGPVLFLIGRITFEYQMFGHVSRSRLAWLLVLVATTPAVWHVPPLVDTIMVGGVLLGIALTDAIRSRRDDGQLAEAPDAAGASNAG